MGKVLMYYNILNFWLHLKQEGVDIVKYLLDNDKRRIIIYGMKELGERLVGEIRDTDIQLVCVIDKNKNILGDFNLITPEDDIPPADLIIVTAEYYYSEIAKELEKKLNTEIISLSMLLTLSSHRFIN